MKALRFVFLCTSLLWTSLSFAQTVAITYESPIDLTVCDTASFTVTLTNNLTDSATMVLLDAVLPSGITYLPGSVINATESNIFNLNEPVFSVANIGSGDVVDITFQALTDCELIAAIDGGQLFTNTYNVNFAGGNNSETTIPYDIETALLQILTITNQELTGTKGDVLTRTITIQNTRLGALSKITFSDVHAGGTVDISTDLGMVSTNTANVFEMMLTGADFMTIGDGDALFELDEVITITENILITDCGFDEDEVASTLTVSWGCNNEICQQQVGTALINLLPSQDNPNLVFTPIPSIPADFCGGMPATQQIEVSNTGSQAATNFTIVLGNINNDLAGIDPTTVQITNAGIPVDVPITNGSSLVFEDCGTVTDIFNTVTLNFATLGPGETLIIAWQSYTCAVDCESGTPEFGYEFVYEKSCPEGELVEGAGSSAGITDISVQGIVTYEIGQNLMDDGIYTMTYNLISEITQDSTGLLAVEYNLPCGLSWHSSNTLNSMALNGVVPTGFTEVINIDSSITVVYEYPMPLGALEVTTDFNVFFDCDVECIEVPECDTVFVSSCQVPCTGAGTPGSFQIFVETLVNLDTAATNACGILDCDDFELTYECMADSICELDVVGYLDYTMDFNRVNLGTADTNDDRFEDPNDDLDLNLIRRNRAMSGDTIRTDISGAVIIDIPGESLANGVITVQFEAHTADDGFEGFPAMNQQVNRLLMTEEHGFENIGASLKVVDASTGEIYTCKLGEPAVIDTIEVILVVPNTRPEQIADVVLLVTYTYDITPANLNAAGCLIPADFTYAQGDSVIFNSIHKIQYNLLNAANLPYATNLRTGTAVSFANTPPDPQPFFYTCNCQSLPWQLSGHRFFFSNGFVNIPPCEPSDMPTGPRFDALLGVGNFFPFEFRNIAKMLQWDYTVPPIATLLESELVFLQLQQGASLGNNIPLNVSTSGSVNYDFDISDFCDIRLDEGWSMRFNHLWELPCTQQDLVPLELHSILEIGDWIPEEMPLDTTQINIATLNPIRPGLFLGVTDPNFISFDNNASWEFSLTNFPTAFQDPAPNVWFYPTSTDGLVTDFILTNLTTGAAIPLNNGLFQLGDFPINFTENYQLTATTNSCDISTVLLNFGWNCEPYTNLNDTPCFISSIEVTVSSPPGELEMDVVSPNGPFDLCAEIPFHTIEIFNAQQGAVFDVNLEAILPSGINLVPGSSELEYPSGSGFQPIADPTLNGGIYNYDISDLNATIGQNGLAGFQNTPNHSVKIRFLVTTECGFVSSSFLEFTATAKQNCDIPTNELSKASPPINIIGIVPPYQSTISIQADGPTPISCGDDFEFTVNMQADGTTLENDSVFVILPQGATYVAGSYTANQNAATIEPAISTDNMGLQVLKWAMLDGLPPNTSISFSLTATGFGQTCDEENIEVQTLQKQSAICISDGSLCEILVETGSFQYEVLIDYPVLTLSNLTVIGNGNMVDYSVQVTNSGAATDAPIVIDFYLDLDGDGQLSSGDTFVSSSVTNNAIGAGATVSINGSASFSIDQICLLLAVFDEDNNCACSSSSLGVEGEIMNMSNVFVCSGDDIQIGVPNLAGHTYEWQANPNISCTNCSETTFSFDNQGLNIETFQLTMTDMSGASCNITNQYTVAVQPIPQVLTDDQTICEGETVVLQTTPASSYTWTGPGITNPNAANQEVTPTETSIYTVDFINDAGCAGAGTIEIGVIQAMIDTTIAICEDSVEYLGIWYMNGEERTDTLTLNGCPQIRTTIFEEVVPPSLSQADEICISEGETFDFIINDIYTSYQWMPSDPDLISCADCPNPTFTPQSTADSIYTLTVIDENGCEGQFDYLVVVLPACSADLIAIPNAFTPNGDGNNDTFGPVFDDNFIKIFEAEDSGFSMKIWNRWGQKVFDQSGSNPQWDGLFKDDPGVGDVYIYSIEITCEGETMQLKGDVSLIR